MLVVVVVVAPSKTISSGNLWDFFSSHAMGSGYDCGNGLLLQGTIIEPWVFPGPQSEKQPQSLTNHNSLVPQVPPGYFSRKVDFQRFPGAFDAQQEVLLTFPESNEVLRLEPPCAGMEVAQN